MKISIYDQDTFSEKILTAKMSFLEMIIEEWHGEAMSHQSWILSSGRVLSANDGEMERFDVWIAPIESITGQLHNRMLSTTEVAKASGVTTARVRQLAPKIPHALKTKGGWLFPPSAVDFVKSQPPPGPVPKKLTTSTKAK